MAAGPIGAGEADLSLDRMAIEDVGANPERLAAAIHDQLGNLSGDPPGDRLRPVPVVAIARALDIVEIREVPLTNIEGALLTRPERGWGSILLNARSPRQRRRFTLAHELGHFLNAWHRPTSPDGFHCSRLDMTEADSASQNRHRRQEAEANRFAIELLAPRARMKPYLRGAAELAPALAMARAFDISRVAAARRYVELHGDRLTVIFSHRDRFHYAAGSEGFPRLCLGRGAPMPRLPAAAGADGLSVLEDVHPEVWLAARAAASLTVQTLHQTDGHAVTLLRIEPAQDEDDDEDTEGSRLEDTFERFQRFEGR